MKTFFKISMAFNVVVIMTLIAYFISVYLPLVFTFANLTIADIPYYSTNPVGLLGNVYSDRYNYEWWVFTSDLFRLLVPLIFVQSILGALISQTKDTSVLLLVAVVLIFVFELLKLLYRGYVLGFCEDFQFCRSFNPANCMPGMDCPSNFIWQWTFYYNIVFVVIMVIYVILLSYITPESEIWLENLKRFGIPIEYVNGKDMLSLANKSITQGGLKMYKMVRDRIRSQARLIRKKKGYKPIPE